MSENKIGATIRITDEQAVEILRQRETVLCIMTRHPPVDNVTTTGDATQVLLCKCGLYVYRAEERRR